MKFSVYIKQKPDSDRWTIELTGSDPAFAARTREVQRRGARGRGFPQPLEAERALCEGKPHADLCLAPDETLISELYENIVIGEPGPGGVERFGRYLSAVLFGDNWRDIDLAAGQTAIKLDLHFDCDDVEMHRLPWEMMFGGERLAVADTQRTVAITRIVNLKENVKLNDIRPSLPLRVLFVIGRQMDDSLRPGAEYLGLLRRMNVPIGGEVQSVDLNVRLLMEATSDDLEVAVKEFKPSVVHFICHGRRIRGENFILLTQKKEADGNAQNETRKEDPVRVERLIELLRRDDGMLPQIVVVNACHTADPGAPPATKAMLSDEKGAYLSFAARLVADGVPVAIGMAGEVADGACRIFTRRFYQALISGESIKLATAKGRRAAMLHYTNQIQDYLTSVEWARPTLFMAKGVTSTFGVNRDDEGYMMQLVKTADKFRKKTNPTVLCDRFDCWKAYQQLRIEVEKDRSHKVLAFGVAGSEGDRISDVYQYGKTRLLEEIAARAVFDGFIPCLVRYDERDPSPNMLSFAVKLGDAIEATLANFRPKNEPEVVGKRKVSRALQEAFRLAKKEVPEDSYEFEVAKASVKKEIGKINSEAGNLPPSAIKALIMADLRDLLEAVKPKPKEPLPLEEVKPRAEEPPHKLLVLIDDMHLYEGVATVLLKPENNEFIGDYGMGDDNLPVALIFTYSEKSANSDSAAKLISEFIRDNSKYVIKEELAGFRGPIEDRLAYNQYLLSRTPPLAANWRPDKQNMVKAAFELLHVQYKGIPSLLRDSENTLAIFTTFSKPDLQIFLDADDETIVRNFE